MKYWNSWRPARKKGQECIDTGTTADRAKRNDGGNGMKVLHIGKQGNMETYSAKDSFLYELETVDMPKGLPVREYLDKAGDADFIVADAIAAVPGDLIRGMKNLKLIHSEGVAFNSFDIETAREQKVYVCNSRGMNASAVAEQTILLMSGMLKNIIENDQAVRRGEQIQVKEGYMKRGDLKELSDCKIGLVGFGDIAKKVARLLLAYGVSTIYYYKRNVLSPGEEKEYHVQYLPLEELLKNSDIVSLHLPVNSSTEGMADARFFSLMKAGSFFVNTSRGELVDDEALIDGLKTGRVSMAGLDTLDHEPVQKDHPLLDLPEDLAGRLIFSPHIGGITASSFRRSYAMIWEDIRDAAEGRRPARVVNPWEE